jgi:16S rRNA (guanine966-N2)-methyltransferase
MRIVGGEHRGKPLAAPSGRHTRPTTDRVREAIFNILEHGIDGFDIAGTRVLDLFAGSGALGLEALSRGARFVQFIDEQSAARGIIRQNADSLGLIGRCKIWRRDASRLGRCAPQPPFDLVFADPPYGKGLASKALDELQAGGWLSDRAVVVIEEAGDQDLEVPAGLEVLSKRDYSDTRVTFLGKTAS